MPLRSDLEFAAGTREAVLDAWEQGIDGIDVSSVRYGAEVTASTGKRSSVRYDARQRANAAGAKSVILSIGSAGQSAQAWRCRVKTDSFVQYTLDDPDEYKGETHRRSRRR